MNHQFLPPPNLAPPSVKHLALEKRIELWANLVDGCEAFLLAGLRSRIGPDGDLQAAGVLLSKVEREFGEFQRELNRVAK